MESPSWSTVCRCTAHEQSIDGPLWSIVVHGYFMVVHGPSMDILRWFHGQFQRQSMDHHELSMDLHRPPWTVHALSMYSPWTTMDCPWNHHGFSTDPPWTTMDCQWNHNEPSMECPWNRPWSRHGLYRDHHGRRFHGKSMDSPRWFHG